MKNKKNIYFLVPTVLIIWGFIGYRIYATLNPSDVFVQTENEMVKFKPEEIKEVEKFTINANYRDPFLGKLFTENTQKKTGKSPSQKAISTITFPQIVYKGMVAPKESSRTSVFFVTINNAQQFLSIGKEIDGVKLLSGNNKEIVVRFQKTIKTVTIQQ